MDIAGILVTEMLIKHFWIEKVKYQIVSLLEARVSRIQLRIRLQKQAKLTYLRTELHFNKSYHILLI